MFNRASNYLFRVKHISSSNTRYEICSKITIKTPERPISAVVTVQTKRWKKYKHMNCTVRF